MSNSTRRLERVGTVVNPTQLFRMWMEDAHQFHSLRDWALSLIGKPDGAYPLVHLPAKARAAVHQEMKGQAHEAVARAAETAEKDVMFLFHLFINANWTSSARRSCPTGICYGKRSGPSSTN